MTLYYSASAGGFLDDTIHGAMPQDARPIAPETHASLIAAASSGSMIAADENGDPIALPLPPPATAELLRQIRTQRDRLLAASDFTQVPDSPLSATQREEWRLYRQALRDLPETNLDPAAVTWPNAPA
ncbi:tail fiber assembly protein [Novosphingobium sp. TCA1]|uniref:tail fiber assembly protein n=1 Tax=Novosphingobium sp. TCA1 TaxID=2682474 RepID=UPI00130C0B9D|nr:tail fiber assembly protein [Novosphingobium sp. TCA1]GFE76244.1 hypothetical protein NTCA1_38930 [Novosphingobium sp. TCA1]